MEGADEIPEMKRTCSIAKAADGYIYEIPELGDTGDEWNMFYCQGCSWKIRYIFEMYLIDTSVRYRR